MTYNISAIKAALSNNGPQSKAASSGTKTNYWKPTIGEHDVRFLPYADSMGNPFLEVFYYNDLADKRLVAPFAFGLPDPIKDLFEIKRKSKDGWQTAKLLRPKERYYATIIVRGEETKGPQIWEFSKEIRDQIYGILSHKDNIDEDMFNPESGYDFTVNVGQAMDASGKPRTFNKNAVKSFNISPRKRPSKLSSKSTEAKQWLDAMPNFEEMFKKQVKSAEELLDVMSAFVAKHQSAPASNEEKEDGTEHTQPPAMSKAEKDLSDTFGV